MWKSTTPFGSVIWPSGTVSWDKVQQRLNAAAQNDHLTLPVPSALAALGLHALVDGLIQNWLLHPQAFDFVHVGQSAMDVYFTVLGFVITPSSRQMLGG